jgi:hypothetical protein
MGLDAPPRPKQPGNGLLNDACVLQVGGSFRSGAVADLDVVNNLRCAGRLGHASGRSFMLNHVGRSFPSDYAVLHMEMKAIFPDLGLCKFRPDRRIDLRIGMWN